MQSSGGDLGSAGQRQGTTKRVSEAVRSAASRRSEQLAGRKAPTVVAFQHTPIRIQSAAGHIREVRAKTSGPDVC